MNPLSLAELFRAVDDPSQEGLLHEYMMTLRARFSPQLEDSLANSARDTILQRGQKALNTIIPILLQLRDPKNGDAGHGPGHWTRDFAHSLLLAHDQELPTKALLSCMVAGPLHDIGTLFVDRYADRTRAVRHAEVGALFVRATALESGVLTENEANLVAWAIAAHTHYRAPSTVVCQDGITRNIEPYVDMNGAEPILSIWLPRWVDRLDCNGPCFVGRHYLTLDRDHDDFDGDTFHSISFDEHMRPLLRSKEAIVAQKSRPTMLEHIRMFAASQTNESPYGRFDAGRMVELRDTYRSQLEHIIASAAHPTPVDIERINDAWTRFLYTDIEPSDLGRSTALRLKKRFEGLDKTSQQAWACAFRTTMVEYLLWADRILLLLTQLPTNTQGLPGINDDIVDTIRPQHAWVDLLIT